jgi:hypothetical protein
MTTTSSESLAFFFIFFSFVGAAASVSSVVACSLVQRRILFLRTVRSGMILKGSDTAEIGLIWQSKGTDARFCKFRVGADFELKDRVLLMNAVCRPMKAFVAV